MRGLKNKRVLVTGAAGAIGRATVRRFIEEGSAVIALDYDAGALASLRADLPEIVAAHDLDITDADAVGQVFDRVASEGGLDALVNNAGVNARHEFTEIPLADWQRVMRTNLDGAFLVAQAAARTMAEAGGVILNTCSTNGMVGYRRHAIYSSSKAALIELTRCMALDLAPRIRVSAVCPGYIRTPLMTADEDQAADIPLGRFGDPDEVAALFAFLASDDATYITGHSYVIDGGETTGGLLSMR